MRVFALSDIHIDYAENMDWIRSLSRTNYKKDVLVLAGDVTHVLQRLRDALGVLSERFQQVFYVPGNHELWVNDGAFTHSVEKFEHILEMCRGMGVSTGAARLGGVSGVWLVPIFSWYTMPDDGEDSLFLPKPGEDPSLDMWSDLYFVKWPENLQNGPARYFMDLNRENLERTYDAPVISFSHFLPRSDLMFSKEAEDRKAGGRVKDRLRSFNFSRVAGSKLIEQALRRMGSLIHIYGHQHRNRYRVVDEVLYVSQCLGYHKEREQGMIRHIEMGPRLVWDCHAQEGNALLAGAGLLQQGTSS